MDLARRSAHGEMSELIGPAALPADHLMRLLGIRQIANRLVERLSGDARTAMDFYVAGVNARLIEGPPSMEYRVAGYQPEPWTAADSLAVYRLMAWSMGNYCQADLVAERLRSVIGDEWTEALYLGSLPDGPLVVQSTGPFAAGETAPWLPMDDGPLGSNAWAVDGRRSITGAPLLAGDPHLGLQMPSVWYEALLEAPGFQVGGVTMPGFPGIGIGRTLRVAWSFTNAMISQTMLYRERLSDSGDQYWDDGEWLPLSRRQEIIAVKGQPDDVFEVRSTKRGPLISDLEPDLASQPVSLHWTGMESSDEVSALLAIDSASTIDDILAVREQFRVPVFNMAAADGDGNIAAISIGAIPVRGAKPGLHDPADWPPAYVPASRNPLELNPESGWVACANHRLVDERYPYPIRGFWDAGYRAERIVEVLDSRPRHSIAEMKALQLDRYSRHAASVVPSLLELLDEEVPAWVRQGLATWDFQTGPESRATAVFQVFHQHWKRLALAERLPEDLVDLVATASGAPAVPTLFTGRLLRGELPEWLDDERRRELANRALRAALDELQHLLEPDPDTWRWGRLCRLTFEHPLGKLPGPQRRRLLLGPFEIGGDGMTVNPASWPSNRPFQVTAGASMRIVADLRRPDQTWLTNTVGENGSPLNRHFRDQLDDYLSGRYHQLLPPAVKESRRRVLKPGDPSFPN